MSLNEGRSDGAQHPQWQVFYKKNTLNILRSPSLFPIKIGLTVSEILRFETFYLEHLGHIHGLQHSQWFESIATINVYTSHN